MLSDPQAITYATVSKSLAAIGRGDTQSTYQLQDSGGVKFVLVLSHNYATRNRMVCRLTRSAYSSDPLVPANSILVSASATLTVDWPQIGMTTADADNLAQALLAWAATSGLMLKVANGET